MERIRQSYSKFYEILLIPFIIIYILFASQTGQTQNAQPIQQDQRTWAIYGSIVTEEGAKEGWLLFDRQGISSVYCSENQIPKDARIIKYNGYIFPGLIDNHNHAQWNALPRWRAAGGRIFQSRYEWLDPSYKDYRENVGDIYYKRLHDGNLEYASLKYAEIRALIGGTTIIQSTYPTPEPPFLVRNLDVTYGADSRIKDITEIKQEEILRFKTGFASGRVRRVFLHIGEGKASDQKCRKEFAELESRGMVRPGVVIIHGIALSRQDFQKMAKARMFLVWSPKSNEVLYKETAKVHEALEEGVTVAVAPDWTITGSNNVLEELKVAYEYSKKHLGGKITPSQLFKMGTSDAAKVAGVEERLGSIAFGYSADIFLAPKLDPNPYKSLLKTSPKHIHLVFIDGVPLYGDPEELEKWVPTDSLDKIKVENSEKALLMKGDPQSVWHSSQRYEDLVKILSGALPKLAPLIEVNNEK